MGNKGRQTSRLANRLLIHDLQIAVYHLRAIFSSLGDGLIAVAGSTAAVALARYGLFSLQPVYRLAVVSIVASVTAPYLYYVLMRRIAFFRSNSVLADVALDVASARQYVLSIATISCLVLAALLLPNLLLASEHGNSFRPRRHKLLQQPYLRPELFQEI